ncbi:hypothetical protein [Streptomyces sp. NPDC004721]
MHDPNAAWKSLTVIEAAMTAAVVTAATPGYLSGAGASTLAGPPIEVKDPPYEDTLYYEDTL